MNSPAAYGAAPPAIRQVAPVIPGDAVGVVDDPYRLPPDLGFRQPRGHRPGAVAPRAPMTAEEQDRYKFSCNIPELMLIFLFGID